MHLFRQIAAIDGAVPLLTIHDVAHGHAASCPGWILEKMGDPGIFVFQGVDVDYAAHGVVPAVERLHLLGIRIRALPGEDALGVNAVHQRGVQPRPEAPAVFFAVDFLVVLGIVHDDEIWPDDSSAKTDVEAADLLIAATRHDEHEGLGILRVWIAKIPVAFRGADIEALVFLRAHQTEYFADHRVRCEFRLDGFGLFDRVIEGLPDVEHEAPVAEASSVHYLGRRRDCLADTAPSADDRVRLRLVVQKLPEAVMLMRHGVIEGLWHEGLREVFRVEDGPLQYPLKLGVVALFESVEMATHDRRRTARLGFAT